MSNKKDRTQVDISGDHVVHFFEKILEEAFKDPLYKPPQPSKTLFGDIDEQEYSSWDPNDPKVFEFDRSPDWLVETWKVYVRRKYKAALDRWNKDTGGGNGQSWSFVNYCDRDARWLVMVFIKDIEANYLLASNAGGRMPAHLQLENGFDGSTPDISSSEESSGARSRISRVSMKKRVIMEEQNDTKKMKTDLQDVIVLVSSHYKERKQKEEAEEKRKEEEEAKKKEQEEAEAKRREQEATEEAKRKEKEEAENIEKIMEKVSELTRKLQDEDSLQSMSPSTREDYIHFLTTRRTRMIRKLRQLEEKEGQSD